MFSRSLAWSTCCCSSVSTRISSTLFSPRNVPMSVVSFDLSPCSVEFVDVNASISLCASTSALLSATISPSKRSTSFCNPSDFSAAALASATAFSARAVASSRSFSATDLALALTRDASTAFFASISNLACSCTASRSCTSKLALPCSADCNFSRIARLFCSKFASAFANSTLASINRPCNARTAGFNSPKYSSHARALPILSNLSFPRGATRNNASNCSSSSSHSSLILIDRPHDFTHDCTNADACSPEFFDRFGVIAVASALISPTPDADAVVVDSCRRRLAPC
mmetsp:Transcript_4678/g.15623  ORF Transcript_4678/g.15623 Transcript_4678/m.15623 type:complete len:286 (-) Transcript_4678:146-1003(-)